MYGIGLKFDIPVSNKL